jgi:hypothetical protein
MFYCDGWFKSSAQILDIQIALPSQIVIVRCLHSIDFTSAYIQNFSH